MYLIASLSQYEYDQFTIDKYYVAESYYIEGFIHLAYLNNFDKVAPRFLEYYSEIVLLILDSSKIDDVIKKHYSKKLDSYYPHLYGPIKKEYVVKVIPLVFDQVNKWQLPDLGDLK